MKDIDIIKQLMSGNHLEPAELKRAQIVLAGLVFNLNMRMKEGLVFNLGLRMKEDGNEI